MSARPPHADEPATSPSLATLVEQLSAAERPPDLADPVHALVSLAAAVLSHVRELAVAAAGERKALVTRARGTRDAVPQIVRKLVLETQTLSGRYWIGPDQVRQSIRPLVAVIGDSLAVVPIPNPPARPRSPGTLRAHAGQRGRLDDLHRRQSEAADMAAELAANLAGRRREVCAESSPDGWSPAVGRTPLEQHPARSKEWCKHHIYTIPNGMRGGPKAVLASLRAKPNEERNRWLERAGERLTVALVNAARAKRNRARKRARTSL